MAAAVKRFFGSYPFCANSITYGSLLVAAEFSQQYYNKRINKKKEDPPEPFDTSCLIRYGIVGTCVNPVILHFWYKWLDGKYVGTSMKIVVKKVLLDQFVMTPPLYVVFFTSLSILEKKEKIFEELSAKFVPTFITSCFFWLPAQAVNFGLVPPVGRIIFISTCSFLWLNVVCHIKRKEF